MTLFTALALYFIIWWVTLFAILPFGVRSQVESGAVTPGTEPGAPVRPRLVAKLIANTIVSAAIFGLLWFGSVYFDIGFADLPSIFPQDR